MGAFRDIVMGGGQGLYFENEPQPKKMSLLERLASEFSGLPNVQQEVPQDLSQYYNPDVTGAYDSTDYEQGENQIATGSSERGNNFSEAVNNWGGVAGPALRDVLYAEPGEDFRQALRDLYSKGIYEPAIGIASTPFAPAPARAAAGLVAAPGFVADMANMYGQNVSGEATGEPQGYLGAALSTLYQGMIDPAITAAKNIGSDVLFNATHYLDRDENGGIVANPDGFSANVGKNPLNLWNEAFIPLAPVEIGYKVGKAGRKTYKDFQKDLDEVGEGYINAPDNEMGGAFAEALQRSERAQRKLEESIARADKVRWGEAKEADREATRQQMQLYADEGMDRILSEDYAYDDYVQPEAPSDFDSWFEGMSRQESGGNYEAVNPDTGAHGRYQIMPENWDAWAEEAGLGRGAERTPENQDIVARHKMEQYYNEYGPEGALVAWYAGPASGERWARGEATDAHGRAWDAPQETGPSIAEYVRSASAHAEEVRGEAPLTEKFYNLTDEISDTGITDLTEQKLNLLARDYEQQFGERLDVTSMKRGGDGTSWHDSGQAVDVVSRRLASDPEARAWLMDRAAQYGLHGLDEYSNPSPHATGGHMHFSDHGEPLKGRANGGRGASQSSGYRDSDISSSTQTGEMVDAFGRDFAGDESMSRVSEAMGKLDEQIQRLKVERERLENDPEMSPVDRYQKAQRLEQSIAQAEAYRAQMDESIRGRMHGMSTGEVPASAGRGRVAGDSYLDDIVKRTKDKRSADIEGVRQYRDVLEQELSRQVQEEVARMEANPGGQGTNNGYLWDSYNPATGKGEGNIIGRYGESNNPQWYQDFYKEYGRAPRKGEYMQIAHSNLMKTQEFADMDRQLRRADEYLKRWEDNPMGDLHAVMDDVDSMISYDRAEKARGRAKQEADTRAEIEAMYDAEAEAQGLPKVQKSQSGGQSANPPKGSYDGETIKNKEYFERMRELFGPLKIGRTPRGARGLYNRGTDVARADKWGNYDTMWHEIGHRLDARHDLSSMGRNHQGEMAAALQRKYPNGHSYKPQETVGEGIAEFVKEYVNDEAAARQHFPGFYKDFERVLSQDKDLAGRLKEAQDMARTYREQPTGAKIAATIQKQEPKTVKEKYEEFKHNFLQNWVDDKHGIRRAEKEIENIIGRKLAPDESAYVYARIAKDRGVSAATQLLTGKDAEAVKKALNKIYGGCVKNAVTLPQIMDGLKGLAETAEGKDWLKAEGLKDVNEALSVYTVARRFMEVYDLKYTEPLKKLKDEQAKAEADLRAAEAKEAQAKAKLQGSKWNTGRAQAQRDFEAAHKEAVKARAAYRKATHAAEAKEEMGYDMPVKYEECQTFVDNAPEAMKKAAQGVYDLNENIVDIMHHEGIISDEVHKSLKENHKHYVSLAREFPDDASIGGDTFLPSGSFINVGSPLKKLSEKGSTLDVKDPMQQMAKNVFNALSLVERNKVGVKLTNHANLRGVGGIVEKVEGDARQTDSSFYVWKNGKKEVYNTTPEIYQALKSLKPEGVDSMMKYMAELPARFMRAGAVVYNPSFVLKNLTRDQLTAYLFSEYGYKPFYDMAKGIYHILKEDELYQEFKTSGVIMSTIVNAAKDFSGDVLKDAQRTKAEKVFHALNPLANLEKLSNFVESGTRMGLYARARGKGASLIEATMEAREGTLDFGKAGKSGRAANKYMPFFNATIQDPALFIHKFKENPARMMKRLAPMVMGSLAIYALIRSNDDLSHEYDQLMPYEKNMFWNIPVPQEVCSTGWIRYPKPFGPGFLFASLPERLADLATGKDGDKKGIKEWAKGFRDTMIPGSMPPLIAAVVEWQANYSFFKQRDVVPSSEVDMEPQDQYGPDTSTFAKWAGEKTGLSPRKIDNAGQNLFAGAYGGLTNLHDTAMGNKEVKAPWETFKLDPWGSPQSTQDYYDRRRDVKGAHKSQEKRGREMSYEDEHDYKRTQKVDKKLEKLNKRLRTAQEDHDKDEVRALKREIAEMLDSELDSFERR